MTDTELNRTIARLLGWRPESEDNLQLDWVGPAGSVQPLWDFLDRRNIHELLDLAVTIGFPRLWQIGDGSWRAEIELIAEEATHVRGHSKTYSHALAHAIVAHKDAAAT